MLWTIFMMLGWEILWINAGHPDLSNPTNLSWSVSIIIIVALGAVIAHFSSKEV